MCCNDNYNCCCRRPGFFEGNETFWIIVVIAIVIIWVHYTGSNNCQNRICGCGCNNECC